MRKPECWRVVAAGFVLALGWSGAARAGGEVNIYSYRQPDLIQPLLNRFTSETGIRTNVVTASAGLEERIAAEGEFSPADILLSVDVGRLENAKALGITQPIESRIVEENIPAIYRDPQHGWVGLTMRGRVFYASRERVKEEKLDYEDLTKPEWKGRLCTRSGQHVYNIGLFANLIANDGAEEATKIVEGIRDNLAMKPSGDDRAQAKAIWAGECDLALGNTYYVGLMETDVREPEQQEWAKSMRVIFPNSDGRGTQVNISGVVLAKHAPNKQNALKLIEFLTSDEAQEIYADVNFEYPVRPGLKPNKVIQDLGPMKPDPLPMWELAKYRKQASEIVDKVDFDGGPAR